MPKISALTSLAQADVVTTTDVLPIVDATAPATTKKVTVQAMVNAGLAAAAPQGGTLALTGALSVSGTSTLGITRVSGADNSIPFGVSGERRGVRINVSSFGSTIEGVDNTLVGSYQPLNIAASVLALYTTTTGNVQIGTNAGSSISLVVPHVASVVNYASVTGAATDNAVRYGVDGSDSNIAWAASSKGSSPIALYTNNFSQLQVLVNHAASAVNYASVTGAATDNAVRYGVGGSDSNITWAASSKGTFGLGLYTNDFTNLQFAVTHTASAVNYAQITGAATGNAVTISGAGSDANIDFAIAPKGTGVLRFGTHSALAAETVTGYITIKDSAGNTRKLAVVS